MCYERSIARAAATPITAMTARSLARVCWCGAGACQRILYRLQESLAARRGSRDCINRETLLLDYRISDCLRDLSPPVYVLNDLYGLDSAILHVDCHLGSNDLEIVRPSVSPIGDLTHINVVDDQTVDSLLNLTHILRN